MVYSRVIDHSHDGRPGFGGVGVHNLIMALAMEMGTTDYADVFKASQDQMQTVGEGYDLSVEHMKLAIEYYGNHKFEVDTHIEEATAPYL